MIQKVWPNLGDYIRKMVKNDLEPEVKKSLEKYGLGGFKFERVALGQMPPRITGIKVYDKNSKQNQIIMDLDLTFASDCDIEFSIKGVSSGIKDINLRGMLRVELKPLISDIPLVGGVQVYFLSQPELDFDLCGLANVFDFPGLSNIMHIIVLELLSRYVVFPNKFPLWSLNEDKRKYHVLIIY